MSVLAPPPQDELELLIKEARERRRRRRRMKGAGAIGIAAALGLALYALVGGGAPANVAQPPASAGRATGPLCRASQLSAVAFFQGSTQTEVGGVDLTNTSGSACSLPAARPAVGVSWNGRPISLQEHLMRSPAPSFHRARVLAPGAKASVLLQWFDQWFCGTQLQKYTFDPRFALRFGHGLTVAATATGLPVPNCGKPGGMLAVSRALTEP